MALMGSGHSKTVARIELGSTRESERKRAREGKVDNGWARRQEQKQRREGATLDEAVNEGNGADDEHRGEDGIETSARPFVQYGYREEWFIS